MSSCGNEVSRWNLRHVRRIAEVLVPVTSPGCAKVSSETPIGGIDQCLHIPGKADSAYSSFSLGSNIPECHIPLYDSDILPLEQLPYLDSGYVRGVFSPCAMHSNLKQIYQDKPVEMSIHNTMGDGKSYGSTSVLGTLYQPPSPVAGFPPHLPHPSSPPAQVDSCKASRNTDQSHYGICFDYSIQAEECSQDTNKTLPLDSPGNYDDCWLSKCKNKSPVIELEDSDIWYPTNQYMTKKNETTISTKPCLNFQDYLKSDSLVPTFNSAHSYNIPEALNSKSSLSPHTNHNAVNDIQENKQYLYACCVHKSPFTEADLPCTMSVSGEKEGQLCGVFKAHKHSGLDQEICESSSPSLKYMDSSLPSLTALGRINTYEDKNHCFSSRDENSRNAGQPLLKQQGRRQKLPSAFQILNGVRKAKPSENNDSPELLTKPKQEEMLAVCSPEQFSKKVESQFQDDSASRKINRKTTPLLYYLSGGKNTDIMSNPNQVQLHEDFDMQSPRSKHSVSAEPIGIPRDSNSCVNDMAASQKTGLILGSPVDEKFKNDYREKLKVAQRKVLRETSFKRKDLQMSLPVRLKQKPSSRPSIQHLRSLSLSGTNEDSRLIPSSKPLENINKQEEPQRPQTNLIGRRKRITKEQKKTSYSEPEKLNQLDDQRDHNPAWRKKNARSRSDEISEQDPMIINNKGLENQGRALSKVELKQIQHNALLQYMERKIGQRPATAHTSTPQKPPLQMRPSNSKKFPEDKISNLSSSKKSQNIDRSCPFSDLGRNLEVPALLSSATSISPDRGSASSSVSEKVNWKMQSAVSEGSCVSRCTATKSLLYLGASVSSRGHGRSKSTPSPMQNFYKSTACPVLTSQDHKYYPFQSSYYVPKKEESGLGNRNENSEENISAENSHCSEMSPECSAFILKETINKDSQLQNERTNQSQMSNASGRIQWQQLQVTHRRAGYCLEDMTACTTILGSLGDKNTGHPSAKGEQNEHDHVFQEQDTELSTAQLKFQEDQRCEDLAVKIVAKDKSLVDILRPHPIRKTALDLMEGLFPVNISISDRSLRIKRRNQSVQENDQIHSDNASDLSHETGHFLEQRADDPTSHIDQILSSSRECLEDPENIISKKKELISSIQLKLQALWDEKELIQSEAKEHAAQGKELESLVQDLCKPNEYERYMMFIGDLEKVVSLLLCLSCRLARVQNAMEKTDENTDAEEKQSLNERHSLLSRQREDAKDLKENLDRRERVVSGVLSKYLTESQLQDYRHFVQAKTLLLIEQKDLEEQIKFLEEQLERLEESIPP